MWDSPWWCKLNLLELTHNFIVPVICFLFVGTSRSKTTVEREDCVGCDQIKSAVRKTCWTWTFGANALLLPRKSQPLKTSIIFIHLWCLPCSSSFMWCLFCWMNFISNFQKVHHDMMLTVFGGLHHYFLIAVSMTSFIALSCDMPFSVAILHHTCAFLCGVSVIVDISITCSQEPTKNLLLHV